MPASHHAGRVVALLLGYLGLTVWVTWPLASELAVKLPCTYLACSFDTLYSAWVVSWLSHALTTAPWHLGDANIYYPDPQALYYGPAGFGAVPYALPAYLATGNAAVATNVTLLACATLGALALHWVVWRWTGSAAAGFVAAWTLLINRWFLWGFVATTTHLAALQYFPLIIFVAAQPLRTWRQALVLLALIVVQCLTDPVYIAPAVLAPLGLLALGRIARRAWRPSGWRLLGVLVAVPLCLVPFMLGYAHVRLDNPALAQQTLWRLASFGTVFGSTNLTSAFWRSLTPNAPEALVFSPVMIGLIVAGALTGVLRRCWGAGSGLSRPWAHALLWVSVGLFLSLTPKTVLDLPWIDGTWTQVRLPLPQSLLATHTSVYTIVRVPQRLAGGAMLGVCLVAGLAAAELFRAVAAIRVRGLSGPVPRWALAMVVAVFAYRIHPIGLKPLPHAYPRQAVPPIDPELVRQLRATDGPLLDLPVFDPNTTVPGARLNARAMYRSTLHWRPLVNGYSSYWPAGFVERLRPSNELPTAPLALRRLVCDTGVRTILVNLLACSADRRNAWLRAKQVPPPGLQFVAAYPAQSQLLFAVTVPLPGTPGGPTCERPTDAGATTGVSPMAPAPPHAAPGSARSGGVRSPNRAPRLTARSDARRTCPWGSASESAACASRTRPGE